ncbi:neutral/alkaline non-lysosomal ceramidase N-terminal domain-containing protein, partial [Bacteroides sp. OttesenSCG-928-D19]|nr:neutral/alkaline non-lysosomal ceramidase N-terminal domain-containing protein [Bacteroides sp. OttesenSCG-928-D19]
MKHNLIVLIAALLLCTQALTAQTSGSSKPMTEPAKLMADTAKTNITPPQPRYPVHDSLYARSLVMEAAGTRIAFIALDLGGYTNAALLERLKKKYNLAELYFCPQHTHSGQAGEKQWLEEKLTGVLESAINSMFEARISAGHRAFPPLSFNRLIVRDDGHARESWFADEHYRYINRERLAHGPTDPEVGVIRLDDARNNPRVILMTYAAHPDVAWNNFEISADYVGYATRYTEQAFGNQVNCLFVQGAAGNQAPLFKDGGRNGPNDPRPSNYDLIDRMGKLLSIEAVKLAKGLYPNPHDTASLQVRTDSLHFTGRFDKTLHYNVHFSTIAINKRIVLATFPGEPFIKFQLDWKRDMQSEGTPFFFGYTWNGGKWPIYVADVRSAALGGYGADWGPDLIEVGAGERILTGLTENYYRMTGLMRGQEGPKDHVTDEQVRGSEAFMNPDLPLAERVADLVSRLTIEEKIAQMMNNAPAIPRLGIPAYNWWNECLHGVARSPYYVTSFPQSIAMAATWDTGAVRQMADYASTEGRAIYHDATRKGQSGGFRGLTYWSPNINIFRDPRWGRGQETYGEDPYLTGKIGSAFVKGLQGDDPNYLKASACAKHYAVHSGPEWNRHTYNAQVSNFDLWDTYLPAFRELVVDADVSGVMCAYNAYFGAPCCGNDLLMMDILRNQWNFQGYVTSDCGGIEDFHKTHKTHPTAADAAADAVLHGTDCECSHDGTYKALSEALLKGLLTEEDIDRSVGKLFEIRFRLGMFDPDDRVPYASIPISVLESQPHQDHALEMARKAIVLLRNEANLLPLDKKKIKKIAVMGPTANDKSVLLANYYGYPSHVSTLLDGIRQRAGAGVEVRYEMGVNLTDNLVFLPAWDPDLFASDGRRGFKAEYFDNLELEGAPGLVRIEEQIDHAWGEGQEVGNGIVTRRMAARYTSTFTPRQSGEVCFEIKADDQAELYIDGVKQTKTGNTNNFYLFHAKAGQAYAIRIVYRQHYDNAEISFDAGTLAQTDPHAVAQSVKDADVIIFAGGITSQIEGEEMGVEIEGFKRGDRTSIALPAIQRRMLAELAATGKPVVFVLMTGSAIGLEWESQNIPAILNAWYGGQAAGEAIADVIFGNYNPGGRLPVTFYRSVDDLPDFED